MAIRQNRKKRIKVGSYYPFTRNTKMLNCGWLVFSQLHSLYVFEASLRSWHCVADMLWLRGRIIERQLLSLANRAVSDYSPFLEGKKIEFFSIVKS